MDIYFQYDFLKEHNRKIDYCQFNCYYKLNKICLLNEKKNNKLKKENKHIKNSLIYRKNLDIPIYKLGQVE